MPLVTIYSSAHCSFCSSAKHLLDHLGIDFKEIRIDQDQAAMLQFMEATNGARTVPQVFIDDKLIGGFSELSVLHQDGELNHLIQPD